MTQRSETSTPGSRRRPTKGDRTSKAIQDTLAGLLATRPLTDITVDELTTGAGISRSTFYFHFATREAVLYALAGAVTEELYGSATVWLRRSGESPRTALRRAVEAIVGIWRANGPVLRAAVRARDVDPDLRELATAAARRFGAAVTEQIDRERADGLAPAAPPTARSLAAALVAMNEQACFNHSLRRPSAEADQELVETLTTIWVRSVYGSDT